jgi:hypothetical protein
MEMYTMLLMAYTLYPPAMNMINPVPVGYFLSKDDCTKAIADFNPATQFRDLTRNMNEMRWGLVCLPAGVKKDSN